MSFRDPDSQVFLIADLQHLHKLFRDAFLIDPFKDICLPVRVCLFLKHLRGGTQIMRFELRGQCPQQELMVHAFNNPVDCTG